MVRLTVEISSPRRRRDALQALLLPVVLNTALEALRIERVLHGARGGRQAREASEAAEERAAPREDTEVPAGTVVAGNGLS